MPGLYIDPLGVFATVILLAVACVWALGQSMKGHDD